jgi:gamma-glutamyltranspeptidase / glutathione hydrolase
MTTWQRHLAQLAGVLLLAVALPHRAPLRAAWGTHGMVAAEHGLASEAGVAILQQGGNAVDAAVATAFAVCVVNPSSCGIGGGGFMLIYIARQYRAHALDYREVAPAAATRDMFVRDGKAVPALSQRGGLAVGVPGEVAGLADALHRYGTLRLATVLQPAMRYARDGFPVGPHLAKEIAGNREALQAVPALARVFLHSDGSPLGVGETLRQEDLAATLQRIADEGPAAFYTGDVAAAIVASVRAAGGVLSDGDLSAYRPIWRTPLEIDYRGEQIFAMPPPSSAGILLEVLRILEDDDLAALRPDSATYLHVLAEAMQHGFADRAHFYGDPDFVDVPVPQLLAPANTAALRRRISAAHTLEQSAYGSAVRTTASAANDHGTSHFSVMDAHGNAVACTTTINTGFGSFVVADGTGVILNNELDDFSAQPGVPNVYGLVGAAENAIAPGKRPLSSMCPVIVTRHGRAVLALGGSGGPLIISGTLQVLLNVLAFDLDAAAAVAAPRVHDQWVPSVLLVEPGIPPTTRATLARLGYSVRELPAMGAVQVVRWSDGVFEGASDPRKNGEAVGW